MTVRQEYRSVFETREQAFIVTVNCVGVMGKGVALEFKQKWPHLYNIYRRRCRAGQVNPGTITSNEVFQLPDGRYAILMPTKFNWNAGSEMDWIKDGIKDLKRVAVKFCLESIALPPPGCGNGGLLLEDVMPLIEEEFADSPDVEVVVCI